MFYLNIVDQVVYRITRTQHNLRSYSKKCLEIPIQGIVWVFYNMETFAR